MGYRRTPFAPDEWYHCYSRGIEGRKTFETAQDYDRFTEALYLSNDLKLTNRENFDYKKHHAILMLPRSSPLVAVGAYCLMPNHFHLLLREIEEGGISKFMHRVGTSYAMYFNAKHKRIGNLFVKPFRSKHISDDRYLKRVCEYIHLNPVELFESGWKIGMVRNMKTLNDRLKCYPYSSLPDYAGANRSEKRIIDDYSMDFLKGDGRMYSITEILEERTAYYASLP